MPNLTLAKFHDIGPKNPSLTVVLLHGLAADAHTYDTMLNFFAKQNSLASIRFVSFDLLGAGASYSSDDIVYNLPNQIAALHASIENLNSTAPIVLVGHSMGAIIAINYAKKYPVKELVLISAPFYTPDDLGNTAFHASMEVFREAVAVKEHIDPESKPYNDCINNIVLDRTSYQTLIDTKIPATIIYGILDRFVMPKNLRAAASANKNIKLIKTNGRHGVTRDKYIELLKILERELS